MSTGAKERWMKLTIFLDAALATGMLMLHVPAELLFDKGTQYNNNAFKNKIAAASTGVSYKKVQYTPQVSESAL